MRLVRVIVGFLLAPRQLLALAAFCMAAGLFWGYATVHENANRKLALRQGPPAAVAVEDYRRGANRGPAGEVVLRAVADPERPLILVMPGTDDRRLAVPLYPLAGGEGAMGAILLPLAPGETVDPADARRPARRRHRGGQRPRRRRGRLPPDPRGRARHRRPLRGRDVRGRRALPPRARGRAPAHRRSLAPLALAGGAGVVLALLAGVQRFLPGLLGAPRTCAAPAARAAPRLGPLRAAAPAGRHDGDRRPGPGRAPPRRGRDRDGCRLRAPCASSCAGRHLSSGSSGPGSRRSEVHGDAGQAQRLHEVAQLLPRGHVRDVHLPLHAHVPQVEEASGRAGTARGRSPAPEKPCTTRNPMRRASSSSAAAIFSLLCMACVGTRLRTTTQSMGFSPACARSCRAFHTISE